MAKYLVALDDGHGMETAGKRTPPIPELNNRVIHENEFNRAVVNYLSEELKRCKINTILVAPTDSDTSLSARTNLANSKKVDLYISIHYNAFDGSFGGKNPSGLSVHYYPGSTKSRKLAECVHKYLKKGTKQIDRSIVESNFYVLRKTKMPAILTENGFMDNKREALLMIDEDFKKEVAREHAKGICEYLDVAYFPEIVDCIPTAPITQKSSEKDVKWLQEKLNKANKEYKIAVTGIFDQKTRIAALTFAESKGWDWSKNTGYSVGQGTINFLINIK